METYLRPVLSRMYAAMKPLITRNIAASMMGMITQMIASPQSVGGYPCIALRIVAG